MHDASLWTRFHLLDGHVCKAIASRAVLHHGAAALLQLHMAGIGLHGCKVLATCAGSIAYTASATDHAGTCRMLRAVVL